MFTLIVTEKGGTPKRLEFDKDEVTIGRVPGNDIILPKGNVSKRHSRVVRQDGRFFVVDLKSTNGTYLNGRRITTPSVIRPGDKIYVGDFVVVVEMADGMGVAPAADESEPMDEPGPAFPPDDAGPPMRSPDGSLVEPLPLDQEPPESAPPPPMPPVGPPARPPMMGLATPGNPMPGARPNLMTQPLGSGPAAAPSGGPPAGMGQGGNKPTQPPPRLGAARPPGSAQTAQLPRVGNNAPPVARPPSLGGAPPLAPMPSARMPGRDGPPAALTQPMAPSEVSLEGPRRAPSAPAVFQPISAPIAPPIAAPTPVEPPLSDEEDEDDDAGLPTGAIQAQSVAAAAAAAAPVPPPSSALVSPPPAPAVQPFGAVAAPATMNIPAATVDAVIASHRAAAQGAEPVPAGREYAQLLGEVVAEARSSTTVHAERMADASTRAKVRNAVEIAARRRDALPANVTVDRLVRDATAELAGAGALEVALEEPDVTSVIVDAGGRVMVGHGGAVGPSAVWFSSDAAVASAVDRLLHASGMSRVAKDAVVDVVLSDGSRLLAVFPPAAPAGPTVVLERPAPRAATLIDLAARGMLSTAAASLLGHAIAARRNIVVAGPPGSGRSTLVAALVAAVPAGERVVAIEARRELGRGRPDVTSIDARPDWKRAIEFGVRLRPHRLALGETNEASAGALVGAMVTGAEGWLLAAEGASPALALSRLAALAGASGPLTRDEAAARIAATRPLVVHLARLGDGTCRAVSIGEARAGDAAALAVEESFALRIEGVDASGRIESTLAGTGVVPSFAESL